MARRPVSRPLEAWRLSKGWSRLQFSELTGIPYTELKRLEQGHTDARWSTLLALLAFVRDHGGGPSLTELGSPHGRVRFSALRRAQARAADAAR